MATLTIQNSSDEGAAIVFAPASAGGDDFINANNELLIVDNQDATSTDVTIVTNKVHGSLSVEDRVVTVPAGGLFLIGPFSSTYGLGSVSITYEKVTSLTIAVINKGSSS